VVTSTGEIIELNASSTGRERDLWIAMRQAGSSFAIATRIAAKVIDSVPPSKPTDGGDFFAVDIERLKLLTAIADAPLERPGLPNYIHVNGVDFLIASANKAFGANAHWVEDWMRRKLGRSLSTSEWARSKMIASLKAPVSEHAGGDKRFGSSGAVPYIFSTQEAFATYSAIMPMACYRDTRMLAALAAVPDARDNTTDLGCYFQVTTTYGADAAFIDYNCPYDSLFYAARQRALHATVSALCPAGMRHYVNTPSSFLTSRDYYPNYDALAAIKAAWDPHEVFRIYQGIRPTGKPPDSYVFRRPYVRTRSIKDRLGEVGWDKLKQWGLL